MEKGSRHYGVGIVCYAILEEKGGIMPRQARIDIPGQMCHVMSRGMERGLIFADDEDYMDFRERIAVCISGGGRERLKRTPRLKPGRSHFGGRWPAGRRFYGASWLSCGVSSLSLCGAPRSQARS